MLKELKRMEHAFRPPETRVPNTFLKGGLGANPRRGRPRKGWLHAVKEDAGKMVMDNWKEVAADKTMVKNFAKHEPLGLQC